MSRSFSPVRIGVVGLGSFGQLHARTLLGLAEAELVAVVDTQPERVQAFTGEAAAMPGAPQVTGWGDLSQAIDQAGAEAWVVASSTASHAVVAELLLRAGASVLVEKPLVADLSETHRLTPLVAEDSRNLMVGHVTLFNSEFRQLLAELPGRGPLRLIDAVRHRSADHADHYPDDSPFRLTMVHDLYQAQALTGGREPVQWFANTGHRTDGACHLAMAELTWEDGAVARLTASYLAPKALGWQGFDRLEVFGEGWAARLQPNPRPLEVWDERVHWPLTLELNEDRVAPTGMLAEQLRCFCRVVRGREAVPVGARYSDALQVMRWLDHLEALAADGAAAQSHKGEPNHA